VSREDLIGEWTLVAWQGIAADGSKVGHGGGSPRGELVYLPSGRMAVQIQHDDREGFGSIEWTAGTQAERAAAFSTYNAYCGTFSVPEEGVVIHHVELAIHPDQVGMDKRREFSFDEGELTLRTQDVETAAGPASSVLRWRRRG
jgi:hypothetical protein